jgi:hypothetical protein
MFQIRVCRKDRSDEPSNSRPLSFGTTMETSITDDTMNLQAQRLDANIGFQRNRQPPAEHPLADQSTMAIR